MKTNDDILMENLYEGILKSNTLLNESNIDLVNNPVANSIARRISMQHPQLIHKYGIDRVIDAINNVAEFAGNQEEIGSSDVSVWTNQVIKKLEKIHGSFEQNIRPSQNKPFADQIYAKKGGYMKESFDGMEDSSNDFKDEDHFINYLSTTLIPDLEESGKIETAKDFRVGVNILLGENDLMGFDNVNHFLGFLKHTLIPDLKESGMVETAKDFATLVKFITRKNTTNRFQKMSDDWKKNASPEVKSKYDQLLGMVNQFGGKLGPEGARG